MRIKTANELINTLQQYTLAYTEHVYNDFDYSKQLSIDEVIDIRDYLQKALRKANALYEALDNLNDIED